MTRNRQNFRPGETYPYVDPFHQVDIHDLHVTGVAWGKLEELEQNLENCHREREREVGMGREGRGMGGDGLTTSSVKKIETSI